MFAMRLTKAAKLCNYVNLVIIVGKLGHTSALF